MKKRIVVFGATGFVGSNIVKNLNQDDYQVIPVSRADCDLTDSSRRSFIDDTVNEGDIVVCAAAKAPAKDMDMLAENVSVIANITEGIRSKKLSYLLNISSDAVYADSMDKLDESSEVAPLNAHGIMHCMREYILERRINAPIGHLRPTLIYGENDPHNGYGPNSFIRKAIGGENISLFGNGEEQRDHIYVGDVAKIAASMIAGKTAGPVNAVTGRTITFMEIAELVREASQGRIEIETKPRSGPMPHNGYRAFSNKLTLKICPKLQYKELSEYIKKTMGNKDAVQLARSA